MSGADMSGADLTGHSGRPGRRAVAGLALLTAVALAGCSSPVRAVGVRAVVSPITQISGSCRGQNAEIEQAADPARGYVYEEWMACNTRGLFSIAVAASADGGLRFGAPVVLAGSAGGWDPSIAVAPNGTVYAAFMTARTKHFFPVVQASRDHGATFTRIAALTPAQAGNFGDRDFIAVGPAGQLYLTWDYGPAVRDIKLLCAHGGSCSYAAGALNIVLQVSADGGRDWGPMIHISPGYPVGGGVSAPLLVRPDGRIDIDYLAFGKTGPGGLTLTTGHSYVTSSGDGGRTWSRPIGVGQAGTSIAHTEWWIDGDIAADAGGTLYATWDTQSAGQDIGWLSYSANGGQSWSAPRRVTPYSDDATHIVEVAGGASGIAYVAWLADDSRQGYALYARPFSVDRGWLSAPVQVSRQFGNRAVWPGDTFGISAEPPLQAGPQAGWPRVVLSWGSAVGGKSSPAQDRAAVVAFDLR